MKIRCWGSFLGRDACALKDSLRRRFHVEGVDVAAFEDGEAGGLGLCVASELSPQLHDVVQSASHAGSKQIIVILSPNALADGTAAWELLRSGASDVLAWTDSDRVVEQVQARFERWLQVDTLLQANGADDFVIGKSAAWRAALRRIVEIARFGDTPTLILGESGTGKEVAAKLIHQLDGRAGKRELVIQDCSTLVPELSGSEFFGHERGAFTGALSDRQGAFALANGGTLFLDEIGELPLPIQAQLLRAIQERTFKRVGGSTWHRTSFRLVCATNRDLETMVGRGEFRADLYHRIAGHVCRLPPLRERPEDVVPLAQSFVREMQPNSRTPTLDPMVRDYLLRRDYPGNVRELKQVVARLMNRCAGDGTISIGYVPQEERPSGPSNATLWVDAGFETMIQRAVMMGAGLKEIGRAAEECAIRCATAVEEGSLKRAALRLGVTDRTLQLRRAQVRGVEVRTVEAPIALNGETSSH
jgi:transcriptional regulator with GAF, ATPase, and Fis domain